MNKKPIYVFGHKSPDTDSVTSAIALSNLKREEGLNTVPAVLGELNKESKYILNKFNIKCPQKLYNISRRISDVNYSKDFFVNENESIFNTYQIMQQKKKFVVPTVNSEKLLTGLVSIKEITHNDFIGNYRELNTTYNQIIDTIEGKEVLKFDENISGEIMFASLKSTSFLETVKLKETDILILGDRHSLIEYAVQEKIKLLIITSNNKIKDKHLEIAKKNKVNIISTDMDSFRITKRISYCNLIDSISIKEELTAINENELLVNAIDLIKQSNYSNYPIINKNNKCLGLLDLKNLTEINKQQVILVDHNEFDQSVDGIEEAEILEIVDHHKIGLKGTSIPINFRNMPVGSTNTIIYLMYKEKNIAIPEDIASLMLSGILSDTLILNSPTTSELDKKVVKELEQITKLNSKEFGLEFFKAGSSIEDLTARDIIKYDLKSFTINSETIGIGQFFSLNINDFNNILNELTKAIEDIKIEQNLNCLLLYVTDILTETSYVYFNQDSKKLLENTYDIKDFIQGTGLMNCVSRKKQIVPKIIENYIQKD